MSEFKQVVKEGAHKFWRTVTKGFLILLLLGLVAGGAYIWVSNWTYSEGTRSGILIKLSKKGVVWKTYEGQLNMGGFQPGEDGVTGNIWEFSVGKESFYHELSRYEGEEVMLYYRQVYKVMPWQGKTEYLVYKVEPLEDD